MSMQCPICLKTADEEELPWMSLYCGHVLHEACLSTMKRHGRGGVQCPICRDTYQTGDERRLFFTLESVEDAEDVEELDEQQSRKLRDRIRNLEAQLSRERHTISSTKRDLRYLQKRGDDLLEQVEALETDLEEKTSELSAAREATRKAKSNEAALKNKIANLKVSLEQERTLSAKQRIVFDTQLHGASLTRQLKNIVDPSMKSPVWFRELLDKRNKMLMNLTKRLEQTEKDKALLQREVGLLQQEKAQKNSSWDHGGVPRQKTSPIEKLDISRGNLRFDDLDAEAPIWETEILQDQGAPSGKESKPDNEIDLVIISDDDEPDAAANRERNDPVPRHILSVSNTHHVKPAVLSKAGPSKMGLKAAPGPSFIGNSEFATTGLDDSAKFIKKGPDGKGGWDFVYQNPFMQRNTKTTKRKRTISSTKDISSFFQK